MRLQAFVALALTLVFSAAHAATTQPWITALGGQVQTRGLKATAVLLGGSWVRDGDLARIAPLSDLARLDLSHTRVTDQGLLLLHGLRRVTDLDLHFAEQVTDGGIAPLRGWTKLRRVNLRGTKVTDTGLGVITGLPGVTDLDVAFAQVTDAGVPQLARLGELRALALGGNKLTEQVLQVLRELPRIEALDLGGKQQTDSGLWFLRVTDSGLEPIVSLRDLRELKLPGCGITGSGLAKLASLQKLAILDLHDCDAVGDAAALNLARVRALRWVDLNGTAVTSVGAEKLRQALPRATVVFE